MVSRGGELVDNAGDLARQLNWNVRYGAVRTFDVTEADARVGVGCFGNALLSPLPLTDVATVALPQAPLDAFVEPAGSPLPGAGLTYAVAPSTIREPRCLLLATVGGLRVGTTHLSHRGSGERRLQAHALADAGSQLLLGDLNAAIDAPELAPLASWSDAFAEPPGSDARISTDDGWRIDHALLRGASVTEPARVLREAGDLSDHYPVVAAVSVPSAP